MEKSLSRGSVGRYWVLYFQPSPETGERISIGLALEEDGYRRLEYDPSFPKVRRLYKSADLEALTFYIQSLKRDFSSTEEPEATLCSYGPQVAISRARRVATPITEHTLALLMRKCLSPEKTERRSTKANDPIIRELEAFVRSKTSSPLEVRTAVRATDLFGHGIPGTKAVALAIQMPQGGWTLIDGIDLNVLPATKAISRAEEVARTFWNYRRATDIPPIKSVGIVLNGNSHLAAKTREAHDYALHRFTIDSNLAVDAASSEAGEKVRALLEGNVPDIP